MCYYTPTKPVHAPMRQPLQDSQAELATTSCPSRQHSYALVLLDLDLSRDKPGAGDRLAAAAAAAGATSRGASLGSRIWGTAEYLAYEVLQVGFWAALACRQHEST